MMMNINDLTFGIEIETHIPEGRLTVGGHGCGRPIPELRNAWKADADPSILAPAGRVKCEFVSPVFQGPEGLRQLLADLETIRAIGAQVNGSCGIHIHVGFDKTDTKACKRLAHLVSNYEKAIYATTGTHSREGGRWCQSIRNHGQATRAVQASLRDRYHLCNFGTCKPTVEFRAFGSSLNVVKIVGYLKMCLGLVEQALETTKSAKWIGKRPSETSPLHRKGGEGQTEVCRLLYRLGWTKGQAKRVYGDLQAEGCPSFDEIKKEFRRLAAKYDGPETPAV
jgi:hypothetical protein